MKSKLAKKNQLSTLARCAIALVAGYLIAVVAFYFLAGEQLRLRDSRGDIALPAADSATVELSAGSTVEQYFSVTIQRLEVIDVQWTSYYRANSGTAVLELYDTRDGSLLMRTEQDMSGISEGAITSMRSDEPLEGLYEVSLLLKIHSPDAQIGSAASPLMNTQSEWENARLVINGAETPGTLCLAAHGTDYIWTGLHYWKFAIAGFAALLLFMFIVKCRIRAGRRSYIANAVAALEKYRFLISQLVSRDFKTKYKRSVLGVLWSFFNPLLMMVVQYFVFSTIFKSDIANYPAYLLIGIVCFNFFSEACGMSLTSILGNAGLITKVYMPKYIYPLTRVMSSVVNLAISLIPLLIVSVATGVHLRKSAVLALFFLVCLVIFSLGLGLVLSSSMVFFRDTQFLWGVLSTIWMYATPIFYPVSILPPEFMGILNVNPLYHFIKNVRICILDGISPEPIIYIQCLVMALGMLLVGALVFRKSQDKFVLYL